MNEGLTVPEDEEEERELTPYQQRMVDGATPLDQRQRARLSGGGEAKVAREPFDPRLAYELALEMGEPLETFAKYGLDETAARKLLGMKAFVTKIKQYREDIVAGGVSFKLKAKMQAEDLLTHSYEMATDAEVPPSVRADLIKWTAAVAGLGPPKDTKEGGGSSGSGGFVLNITFPSAPSIAGAAAAPAIDVVPIRVEGA